jgi:uncharacterized protein (DUF1697 family)
MSRFVALLRAVNVGGANRVPMAELRAALSSAGFSDVRTYLQSGNIAFEAPGDEASLHAARITEALSVDLNADVEVLVLACSDLLRIAAENPFAAEALADDRSVHVVFPLGELCVRSCDELAMPAAPGESAVSGEHAIYLHLPDGYGRSKLTSSYFERALHTPMTARNWRTVSALVELCSAR